MLECLPRLPANRHKRHPGKSLEELLALDIPLHERPSSRTVTEKLIAIGGFLKWCRDIQGYLSANPIAGISVAFESISYAPFTTADLRLLFHGQEYLDGTHGASWHFWVPLMALYSVARQSEIAQLAVTDIVREEGK